MNLVTENTQKERLPRSLFDGYEGPSFAVQLWDGWCWQSPNGGSPDCTIIINSKDALRSLLLRPSEVTLGEAFLAKNIEVEGNLFSVFDVAEHIFHSAHGRRQRILETASGLIFGLGAWIESGVRHSQERDRRAISYHYDQPVDFYWPWLGETLAYSCAYFQSGDEDLDTAQAQKFDLVCRKLRLRPGERYLDIGCGWGSLILHAASHYKVDAYGITISQEQRNVAADRIADAHLTECCHVELLDYRKALETFDPFDKISSVGMVEHVGLRNLPLYFRTARALLKPGGVFLNLGS